MQLIPATEQHYSAIGHLVTSPEELYLVCPNGHFPWDVEQLKTIAAKRHGLTVGIMDNRVVAFANLYDLVHQQSAFIGNVIVAPDYRGRGLGKTLIHHMINVCQDKYQTSPHISVFNDNTRALLLYAELGFTPYSLEPRLNLHQDKVALIHMKYAKR
ncbi:GNAT family N-acetyltransferase [Leptolyngbya cf. ectocarpi LEGE 11479]|uniref:GNAT family N-acetyltransferase n=1 Tax=Leptolyngbya cf. ectocarpi LEGE 11479 TaxID=1828722 RepID=A0A928X251_LEPEC|nr:GNAT family N-acetyltransferase [Leptolyngbya ectocarpi]MBE9067052.1 GNAT family N-acetyltransferase [Leptolyngbya cf. ectocarpi LEGE 11479]